MEPIHAIDSDTSWNSITYVILKRDKQKQLIVAFSGTRDIEQLITEIAESFWVGYAIHPQIQGAKVFDYFYRHYVDGLREDYSKAMQEALAKYPDYTIYFTGHSLGGAITAHAAGDYILNGWGNNRTAYIYTFGQPRVGNPAFTEAFYPQLAGWYRVTHNRDLIAHIPPCIPGFTVPCLHDGLLPYYDYHSPQEIYYDSPFENYIECSLTDGEDPSCSNSHINESISDHRVYFGVRVASVHKEEVVNATQPIL